MKNGIANYSFIKGSGEMATLTREKDWSATPLGNISTWPQSLLSLLNMLLNSGFPMLLMWGKDLTQFYNDAFRPSLGASGKHPEALGQKAKDCWAEIWDITYPRFKKVIETGEPYSDEDQLIPIFRNGKIEDVYWTFSYSAAYDDLGNSAGIFVTCIETTNKVLSNKALLETKTALELAKAETENQRDRLTNFFMEAPAGICILSGPDFVYEFVNPAYQSLVPGRDLIGKPIFTALPELKGQPIENILNYVYKNDKTYEGHELKLKLSRNGLLEDMYFNFIYQPKHNAKGEVDGLLVFVYEVTEMAEVRLSLEESEMRFRSIVEQSPVPIMFTRGKEMIIEETNEPMLQLIRHDDSIKGKSVYDAMPELRGQQIMDHLYNCFYSGESWKGYEQPILLIKDGVEQSGYYNVTYQPFRENGKITGILHSAIDVTTQVLARKQLEKTEDTLRLSLLAANLGTFDLDLENNKLYWDKRCRTLFGISHDNEVSYEKDFLHGLHPADKDRILDIIENYTLNKAASNGDYDVEYRTVGADDKKVRWIRAMGKAYFNEADQPVRFIGSVLDITEQKEDELRKNDFIGMVSHELKTPLTSLKAYAQMLQSENYAKSAPAILPKIDLQLKKMNDLINGFLNVARFESGKLTLEKQSFNIDALIDEIVEAKKLIAPNHTIIVEKCAEILVVADKEKIDSVIRNLISNAIKYSDIHTTIKVECKQMHDIVEISVEDEGIGIKKEDIDNLFQRYYRVENIATKNISGFGIGLYLSAEIVKRHGGTIGVKSTPRKGSRFYFTLPLSA